MLSDRSARPENVHQRPSTCIEDAMVSLTTPAGQLGWLAAPFDLPGTDGRRHTLESVRGANGTVVMFICNHCPYVKAVVDKIVRDMTELRPHGVGSIAIMSNDPAALCRGFVRQHEGVRRAARLQLPLRAGRNAGRCARLRRRLHARFLRLRPRPQARLPRPARRVGALSRPGRRPRAVRRDAVGRAHRQRRRRVQQPSIGCSIKWKASSSHARSAASQPRLASTSAR